MTVIRLAAASFFLGPGQLGGEAAKVVRELGSKLKAGLDDGT